MQKKIKANLLETGLYYQKDPNLKNVKKIVDNFDWNLFRPLDVSRRDGHYYVVDGQHRLFAIRQMYGTDTEINIPCDVREGLTKQQECELFFKLNTGSRYVTPMELYKSLYANGLGKKDIVDMYNKINYNGLILDWSMNKKKKGRITAISTIYAIYKKIPEYFDEYIRLLKDTWDGEPNSLKADMLNGVCDFLERYHEEYDYKTFVKKLKKYSPEDILKEGNSALLDGKIIGCSKSIFNKYNKQLKGNKRLEPKY